MSISEIVIPNFLGGLSTVEHATNLELNQAQTLENFVVDSFHALGPYKYQNALTVRPSYSRITDQSNLDEISHFIEINIPPLRRYAVGLSGANTFVIQGLFDPGSGISNKFTDAFGAVRLAKPWVFKDYYTASLMFQYLDTGTYSFDLATETGASVGALYGTFGVVFKDRFWTNEVATLNMLKFSDVGAFTTFGASNFINIGDPFEKIIGLIDGVDKLIIFKEKSTWYLYPAAELINSILIRVNSLKGIEYNGSFEMTDSGLYVFSRIDGLQVFNNEFKKIDCPINNLLKSYPAYVSDRNNFRTNQFYYDSGVIYIGNTINSNGTVDSNNVYVYDIATNRVFNIKLSETLNVFKSLTKRNLENEVENGTALGADVYPKLKAMINKYVVEFDSASSPVEATIPCLYRTGDYHLNAPGYIKNLHKFVLTFIAPNNSTQLTVKSYGDMVLKETKTITPSTGFNVVKLDFNPNISKGYYIGFQIEYSQPTAVKTNRFSLLNANIKYSKSNELGV